MTDAIHRGIDYLHQHQFPNGEFASYVAADLAMHNWTRPDSTVFTTVLISHCLSHFKSPESMTIQKLALDFLGGQMNYGGLWNHFTRYHPYRYLCPLDADDTSCTSALFRQMGINWPFPSNIPLMLANRNKQGLFYSWFLLRFKPVRNRTYWKITLPELLRPVRSFFFWMNVEASRNDIDGVVNANVLYYLGERPETEPVIEFMIAIIRDKREGECDLWYRDTFFVYYFFSRNYYAGIRSLAPIREPVIERILARQKADGCLGESILDTAWAVCSLINLGYKGSALDQAAAYLLRAQSSAGNWPRWLAYYGGPKKVLGWGSEELTTGFCIEALARYSAVKEAE